MKVFAPVSVTAPAPVFVAVTPVPARIAETEPDWRSYEVPVSVPVVPVIAPPVRWTAPTMLL